MVQLPMPDILIDKPEDSRCGVGWNGGSRRSGITALHASVATVALLLLCWVALGGRLIQPVSRGLERMLPEAPEAATAAGSGGGRSGGHHDALTAASGSEIYSSSGLDIRDVPGDMRGNPAQEQAALTQVSGVVWSRDFLRQSQGRRTLRVNRAMAACPHERKQCDVSANIGRCSTRPLACVFAS